MELRRDPHFFSPPPFFWRLLTSSTRLLSDVPLPSQCDASTSRQPPFSCGDRRAFPTSFSVREGQFLPLHLFLVRVFPPLVPWAPIGFAVHSFFHSTIRQPVTLPPFLFILYSDPHFQTYPLSPQSSKRYPRLPFYGHHQRHQQRRAGDFGFLLSSFLESLFLIFQAVRCGHYRRVPVPPPLPHPAGTPKPLRHFNDDLDCFPPVPPDYLFI